MAKINIYIPEPQEPYTVNNFRQINQSLETLQNQLNTSYQNDIKNQQEAFAWFLIGTGKIRSTNKSNGALLNGSQLNISLNSITVVV